MTNPTELEGRVSALEARMEVVAADAKAARHLAAARDRDLADLGGKIDASRSVLNALAQQTAERFDAVDLRFEAVDRRLDGVDGQLSDIRTRFGEFAGVQQHVVELLTTLVDREGDGSDGA